MSTNDTGGNNPYRVPGDAEGEPNRDPYGPPTPSGQPPAYGQQQPPAYGQPQPPSYGQQQPPAYGQQQPPAYGQQPPAYGAPYGGGFPQHQGFGPAGGYPDNKLGGWSLGLALAAIVLSCGFLTGIPAIIVGMKGLRAAAAGTANNRGMAMAGVVIGWIMTILSLLGLIFFIVLIAGGFGEFSDEFMREFEQGMSDSQAIAPAITPAGL